MFNFDCPAAFELQNQCTVDIINIGSEFGFKMLVFIRLNSTAQIRLVVVVVRLNAVIDALAVSGAV